MDRAPLPPHERPWRHPSELGPPTHEPTTTAGRVLIATTATLSLALVGLLVVSATPERAPDSAERVTTLEPPVTFAALERPALPLVTPIGDDGWAVTTTGAVGGREGVLSARLASGTVLDVEVVGSDDETGLTVVSLPMRNRGYRLAEDEPAPTDTVLVDGTPPRVVVLGELARLDVAEATPVLDADGQLIGLCSDDEDGTALRPVATMPSTTVATTTPTTVATTTPSTLPTTTSTSPPTTVATTTVTTAAATTLAPPPTVTPTSVVGPPVSSVSGAGGASGGPG